MKIAFGFNAHWIRRSIDIEDVEISATDAELRELIGTIEQALADGHAEGLVFQDDGVLPLRIRRTPGV